jgi:hypothetical protein
MNEWTVAVKGVTSSYDKFMYKGVCYLDRFSSSLMASI